MINKVGSTCILHYDNCYAKSAKQHKVYTVSIMLAVVALYVSFCKDSEFSYVTSFRSECYCADCASKERD